MPKAHMTSATFRKFVVKCCAIVWKVHSFGGRSMKVVEFATLAHATMSGLANNTPAASGATCFGILGKLLQPPRLAKF